ncbi:endolytic transglycosylase MltG [Galactobacter caseinivorans]|uniref:Endolytic murein transglycosylase n=1 Tax=Galactobacter caseinivorans TaxID=2676123 RepID=A0A496PL10_9MICC|nr:endolytic transglycosylase MltG [Galactobacter caseinivorans]RKW71199.1 endolytic transglycosylase MltG [Galactobacter caseinivorans]
MYPTGGESPEENEGTPRRRRRARRQTPARRFHGVGRHGMGDNEAVLMAQAVAEEAAEPSPVAVAPVDEFDQPLPQTDTPDPSLENAPLGEGVAAESLTDPEENWLQDAEQEAEAAPHVRSGFADAMARHGSVPAGYLPAEDIFAEEDFEVDLADRRRRRRKRAITVTSVVTVIIVVLGLAGFFVLRNLTAAPEDYPGPGTGSVSFEVKKGWGTKQIAKGLAEAGVVKSAAAFEAAAKDQDPAYQPGTFDLKREMTSPDVLASLTGKSGAKVSYFSLPANTRMPAALKLISEGTGLPIKDLESLANRPSAFGLPAAVTSLEGYLHPGEYRLPQEADAKAVLAALVKATQDSLKDQGVTDPTQQYRILNIASIVAAEARQNDFKHVAGIIDNRLSPKNKETGGRLEVDSSVSYGLGQTSIHLTKAQKADKDNEYNSYQHTGLPPTPIGSPGDSAIEAAAKPDKNDDFYWVTVNLTTGETKFAPTYAAHLKNVAEYRTWCDANADVCK